MLQLYHVVLYATSGKTIKISGLAHFVKFQLGRYELETNEVVDDAIGVESFLWE